jgi:hypothetical protein
MNEKKGLLGSGLFMVLHNKRYILWFWLLNILLTIFGTSAFRGAAHPLFDRSLYSEKLLHGLDLQVVVDMFLKPEFGAMSSMTTPAVCFAVIFFLATALFLPGVFAGYASTYRLPRDDFFRACGRNLWRFIRIMIVAGIVMGIVAGLLFAINGAIVKKADDSTNELLPFELQMFCMVIIFLVMTTMRIWFDLAEADTVLNDQRAVRKSIGAAFLHTFRGLFRLLFSYLVSTIVAALILVVGIWCWLHFAPSDGWFAAAVIAQITLLLLLIPRFWQRGIAVAYWQQHMMVPVVAPVPVPPPVISAPLAPPVAPVLPEPPMTPGVEIL